MLRSAWGTVIVTLLGVLGPSGASAQSTASISGVVKDTQGSILPGVSVSVKNESSGPPRTSSPTQRADIRSPRCRPGPTP